MKTILMTGRWFLISLVMIVFPVWGSLKAQENIDRIGLLSELLDSLSRQIPGLSHNSDLALSDVPLSDYVRALGKLHQVNVYIDDMPNTIVTNNFVNEPVKSIFVFICKKFNLSIEPVGTILNFLPYSKPKEIIPPPDPRVIKVGFEDGLLSFDLDKDSLDDVIRLVSRLTGKTIITSPGCEGLLSGYIPPSDVETAIQNIMFMNGFNFQKHRRGFYLIEKATVGNIVGVNQGKTPIAVGNGQAKLNEYDLHVAIDSGGVPYIFLKAENVELNQVVRDLFDEIGMEYYVFDPLQGTATLSVEGAELDDVLRNILKGTEFTYKNDNGVYMIGKRSMEGLRQVCIMNLKYRPTSKVIELMPSALKEAVELKEFVELNRIIVSGPSERIREIEVFIKEIDRPVPMVKIEMVAVDVDFNRLMQAGIKAGMLQPGDTVGAVKNLVPGLDYSLNGSEINDIISASGIPFLSNIGALRSNFYLQLQASESKGLLKVVTRPVISTLNGNEASIMIGQTNYYLLQTNTASNGAVNSFNQVSQRFETIEINTKITVKPYVSQDGMVTLEIKPDFTTPGTQVNPNIPPTILKRSFQSTIRVRDGETVVLGGLSREATSSSSEGLPFLSRVPVLKWFLGTNSRNKSRSSLIIYITPTITYN